MGHFDNYKFRCSALGKIVSKSGKLIDTNKTYLTELFIGEMEGIRKEITSKYFEKGKFCEEDGITLLKQCLYPRNLIIKNKERRNNDWIHGEADCITPDGIVYDIKNAFDRFTFGKADLTWEYEWQGRGYMWLYDQKIFRLFYCLNNMPEHMMVAEERKLFYSNFFLSDNDPEFVKLCKELRDKHTYDKMPLYARFKVWEIGHSEDKIEQLQEAIKQARVFLNQLFEDRQEQYRRNCEMMGIDFDVVFAAHHDSETGAVIVEGK